MDSHNSRTWLSSRTSWSRPHKCSGIRVQRRENLLQLCATISDTWNWSTIYSFNLNTFLVIPHIFFGPKAQPPALVLRGLEHIIKRSRGVLARIFLIPQFLALEG